MVRYARANRKIIGAYHLKLGSLSKETSSTTNNDSQSTPGKYTAETYTRRADHTPQPAQRENKTYILTLKTDIAHQETLTSLRNKYFPTIINKLFAHVTLFRALPGSKLPAIQVAIKRLVRQTSTFPISTGEPFLMSYGVGLDANVEPAKEIFETLRKQWSGFLSIQDRSFKPHYTIQNYVDQSVAEETLAEVRNSFGGSAGTVQGLLLFLYNRGSWRLKSMHWFKDGKYRAKDHRMNTVMRPLEQRTLIPRVRRLHVVEDLGAGYPAVDLLGGNVSTMLLSCMIMRMHRVLPPTHVVLLGRLRSSRALQ
ncbi:MAG: hypothetical protein Q9223_004458 [Gallowayella weberi]